MQKLKPKICLLRCPVISMPYPPDLGLGYISAILKRNGYQVKVIDLNWDIYWRSDNHTQNNWLWTGGSQYAQFNNIGSTIMGGIQQDILSQIHALMEEGFNIFGFSVWDTNKTASLSLAQLIKKNNPQAMIMFGGPACMPLLSGDEFVQNDVIDAIVYGEGEETVVELIRSLEGSKAFQACSGAYVRIDGQIIKREPRKNVDLSSLPYPDFSDYEGMCKVDRIGIMFNRGCVRKCKYCSVPIKTPLFRWRFAEDIFAEMKFQINRYGIRKFYEFSPTTNSNHRELMRLCDLIIESKLDIQWQGFAIFNSSLTTDAIKKLSKAGCMALAFGLESGSERVLTLMNKQFSIREAERILKDCKAVGINTILGILVGYPGETEDDFQKTVRFLQGNAEYIYRIGSISDMQMERYSPIVGEQNSNIINWETGNGWHTRDMSNTPEIRKNRQKRLVDLASSLDLFPGMLAV